MIGLPVGAAAPDEDEDWLEPLAADARGALLVPPLAPPLLLQPARTAIAATEATAARARGDRADLDMGAPWVPAIRVIDIASDARKARPVNIALTRSFVPAPSTYQQIVDAWASRT